MFGILRTLLAINVILLHVFGIPSLGNYSVSFFFILSGFLMTYIMQNTYGYSIVGFKSFWKNRILRLYPIYWAILLLSLVFIFFYKRSIGWESIVLPTDFKNWLFNFSIIYPDLIPHRIKPIILPASWALTNELTFYLLLSLGLSKTRFSTIVWVLVSVLYIIFAYYYKTANWRYSAIPAASLPFSIGALLYWFNDEIKKLKGNIFSIVLLYFLFYLNVRYIRAISPVMQEISIFINYFIASIMILQLFNYKSSRYVTKIDTFIGHFSYPFYLAHYLIYYLFLLIVFKNKPDETNLPLYYFIPYLIVLFIFSFILIYFIDFKIANYKNRNTKK